MDTENYMNEKSAFIAIVGRPNVGKSSILNRLLGTKLAIVSNKPQTTRTRIMGVWTEGETQLVFIDTPGLIKPKNSLGDYMVKSVTSSVADVDACLLVVEANTKISKADEELVHRFKDLGVPALLAINKIDLLQDKSVLMEQIAKLSALYDFEAVVPVSAQDGNGMDALREELIALAEPGGHFFSEDTLTDQPERVIASEIVREKILRFCSARYGVFCGCRLREKGFCSLPRSAGRLGFLPCCPRCRANGLKGRATARACGRRQSAIMRENSGFSSRCRTRGFS